MAAFVGEDPMSGEDASHPEGVGVPSQEPRQCIETEGFGGDVGREGLVGDVGASCGEGGVAEDKVHGVEVGSFEAFFGDDRLDLSLGGELGGLGVQRVVGADPVSILRRGLESGCNWYG